MAKKGEYYGKIAIALDKALRNWMDETGIRQPKDVAQFLQIPSNQSGRVNEILRGERNTKTFVKRFVKYIYQGDWNKMARYIQDRDPAAYDFVSEEKMMQVAEGWTDEKRKKDFYARRELQRKLDLDGHDQEINELFASLKKKYKVK